MDFPEFGSSKLLNFISLHREVLKINSLIVNISIENLEFGYNHDKMVLDGISLFSDENNSIAIVGASGCGKSTLLRILSGIIEKSKSNYLEGKISIGGLSPREFTIQGNTAFMFQEPTLFPNLTVRENIELPLKIKKSKSVSGLDKLIEIVGLEKYINYFPSQLSGGMKTRVSLARTFITNPRLLLLDEPFSALDVRWKFLLYRELETLRQTYSSTILIVTHDIQEALLLANHIIVLGQNGKVLKEYFIDKPLPRVFKANAIKDMQDEYLEIHDIIMNDGVITTENFFLNNKQGLDNLRDLVTSDQAQSLIQEIEQDVAGKDVNKNTLHKLALLKKFTGKAEIHVRLTNLWEKVNDEFKYQLLWRILEYPSLDSEWNEKIYTYFITINDRIEVLENSYLGDKRNILEKCQERINDPEENPISKKWAYLCLLPNYYFDDNEVKKYFTDIVNNTEYAKYPFMQNAATRLLKKYYP